MPIYEPDSLESQEPNDLPLEDQTPSPPSPPTPEPPAPSDDSVRFKGVLEDLKEERRRSHELKTRLASVETRLTQFDALRQELDAHRRQSQVVDAQTNEKKALEDDPIGYLKSRIDNIDQDRQVQHANIEQITQVEQAKRVVMGAVQERVSEFIKETPDYPEAFNHLANARMQEFQVMGIPQGDWATLLDQEATQLSVMALRSGRNPAEIVYAMAKARGYTAKAKGETTVATSKEPDLDLDMIERGQEASKTLNTGRRAEGGGLISRVEKMSDAEFDKFWDEEFVPRNR